MNWHVLFPPKLGVIVVSLQNDQNVRQMDHTLGGLTERVPPVHCTPPPAASSSITRERSCHTFCSLPHPHNSQLTVLACLLSISPSSLLPLRKYGCKVPLTDGQIAWVRCFHGNFLGVPAFRGFGHTKVSAIPSRETRCSPLSGDCTHLSSASQYAKFVEICWNSPVWKLSSRQAMVSSNAPTCSPVRGFEISKSLRERKNCQAAPLEATETFTHARPSFSGCCTSQSSAWIRLARHKLAKPRGCKGQAMVRERLRCDCDWKGGHWLLAKEKQAGALGHRVSTKPRPRPFAPCTELTILWLVAPQTRPQPSKPIKSAAKLQSRLQSANWDQCSTEHCFVECKGPAPWDPSSRCNLAKKML